MSNLPKDKTLITTGSVVSWKDNNIEIFGKVVSLDRVFEDGDKGMCVSCTVLYDERYRAQFPLAPDRTYMTWPTHMEVRFV